MDFHFENYSSYQETGRFVKVKAHKLDLHGIRHEDVNSLVENFVLRYQDEMPLEIVYGNSPVMRSLVEECLEQMGFAYNEGYQNAYGRLLVMGYGEEA